MYLLFPATREVALNRLLLTPAHPYNFFFDADNGGTPTQVDRAGNYVTMLGFPGSVGWSPLFGITIDGARRVHRYTDFVGGEGTLPDDLQDILDTPTYVGANGPTTVLADAVDLRGPAGAIVGGEAFYGEATFMDGVSRTVTGLTPEVITELGSVTIGPQERANIRPSLAVVSSMAGIGYRFGFRVEMDPGNGGVVGTYDLEMGYDVKVALHWGAVDAGAIAVPAGGSGDYTALQKAFVLTGGLDTLAKGRASLFNTSTDAEARVSLLIASEAAAPRAITVLSGSSLESEVKPLT